MPAAGSVSIILFIIYSLIDKLPRIYGDETGKESNLRRGDLAHTEPSAVSVVIVGMSRSLCYERALRRGRGLDFGASTLGLAIAVQARRLVPAFPPRVWGCQILAWSVATLKHSGGDCP
jgi:hypothetical protein